MLIAFEGGEGTGKSTQAQRLAARLGERALFTWQPGATAVGAAIRRILLDPATEGLVDRAEALLMAADRAQHVHEVIRPALAEGRIVVCDRYIGSSLAYQGAGRGLGVPEVAEVSAFATDGLAADLVVLLVVPREVRDARLAARGGDGPDRIERAGVDFHDRVDAGFRSLAEADPDHWVVVDGVGTEADVADRVWSAVSGSATFM